MIEIVPIADIDAKKIRLLRQYFQISIADITRAATHQRPLLSVEPFGASWEDARLLLASLSTIYADPSAKAFQVQEREASGQVNYLSPCDFVNYLQGLRAIELDTQLQTDLEAGTIGKSSEFIAHDADWLSLKL